MFKKYRDALLHALAALLIALPSLASISNISGFTTRADGDTITAAIWNSELGGIYTYINTNLVAALNTLTTKGDLFACDGSALKRLAVGTNGQVLTADSTAANGVAWATPASTTTLTTKGDLLGHNGSALVRVGAGTNGQLLQADSTAAAGVSWTSDAAVPTGVIALWSGSIATIPSGWHLCDGTAGTINLQGLFVVGAGNVSPAATGGMGLISPSGPAGDTSAGTGLGPNHTHSISTQAISAGTSVPISIYGTSVTGSTTVTPRYYALAYIQKV